MTIPVLHFFKIPSITPSSSPFSFPPSTFTSPYPIPVTPFCHYLFIVSGKKKKCTQKFSSRKRKNNGSRKGVIQRCCLQFQTAVVVSVIIKVGIPKQKKKKKKKRVREGNPKKNKAVEVGGHWGGWGKELRDWVAQGR